MVGEHAVAIAAPCVCVSDGVVLTFLHAVAIDEGNLEFAVALHDVAVGRVALRGLRADSFAVAYVVERQVVVTVGAGILGVVVLDERLDGIRLFVTHGSRQRIGDSAGAAVDGVVRPHVSSV